MLDGILRRFEGHDYLTNDQLYDKAPKGFRIAVEFLVKESYLEKQTYYYTITFKGQALINDGGFFGKYRRKRIQSNYTIIAAVASVLSLFVALIALILQILS